MAFASILFERAEDNAVACVAPAFFADLNLDQIVDAVTAGREAYNLKEFFYTPLANIDAISYRQEIFQDLEDQALRECIKSFAQKIRWMLEHLAQLAKLHNLNQRNAWLLDAIEFYCDAVTRFNADLSAAQLRSSGLRAFREYLSGYSASPHFTGRVNTLNEIKASLSKIEYCVLIDGDKVSVRNYQGESDYSKDIEETFEKFKQGAAKDYRVKFRVLSGINHIEAQILDFVARLNPEIFSRLADYCAHNTDFIDKTIAAFDREIQLYVAYLEYIAPLRQQAGLRFCYPEVSGATKEIYSYDGFDLALAKKLVADKATIVCNDCYLTAKERIIVITGPNQGGKTTFARSFGQLHYLAAIGCPVPGRAARLFHFEQIFTHFEREEKVENLRGKLQDDLLRIHSILEQATPHSIVVMNEVFTSTTLQDEIFLSEKVMKRLIERDLLCVWVTFVDELSRLDAKTVSMVSTVVPQNPAMRTFKIVRRPADGLAYALAIAEKHRLTYGRIKERLGS